MTTIPPNFNPTIPARGTPEFARYAAEVMTAYINGSVIIMRARDAALMAWVPVPVPGWEWNYVDYAILPDPAPSWPSDDVWSERFTDPKWQCVLVRLKDEGSSESACLRETGCGWTLESSNFIVHDGNIEGYEISHDGGKTWGPIC